MAASIGIHVGGTSACLAIEKDGKTGVVANEAGDRTTPMIVAFRDQEKVVGLAAKQGQFRNASNTITGVRNVLGKRFDNPFIQTLKQKSSVTIVEKSGYPVYSVEWGEKQILVTPRDVLVTLLKNVKVMAEHQGGDSLTDTVLTVPADASEELKAALRKAGEDSGLTVLRCLSEPAAAALAYDIGQNNPKQSKYVLVFKFGGSHLSVTVLLVQSGMFRILGSKTEPSLNGDILTKALTESSAAEFKRQYKADISDSKRSVAKLYRSCETAKHVLSSLPTASLSVDSLYDGIDFHTSISRAKYESVVSATLSQCADFATEIVRSCQLKQEDITQVVLAGGSAKTPKLQQLLRNSFPDAEILTSIPPEEVLAIGAAKEAAILACKRQVIKPEDLRIPTIAADIIVKVAYSDRGSSDFTIVQRGTYLPVKRHQTFKIMKDETSVALDLLYKTQDDAVPIGKIVFNSLEEEDLKNGNISGTFHFKRDGSLEVTCTSEGTGSQQNLLIVGS